MREITFVYDTNGLDYIQDAFGRVTQVSVNGSRDLTAIKDPDGDSTAFAYSDGLLQTMTDRLGAATTIGYHPQAGKVTSVTAPPVALYGEPQPASPATTLMPWQIVSTPYGATSGTPFTTLRADSVRAVVTDAGGHAVRFSVNALGQPLRTMAPLGDTVTVTYNTNGLATQVVDRLGVTSSFTIDASGFVTSATSGGITRSARRATGWVQADSLWGGGAAAQRLFVRAANGLVDSVRTGGRSGVHDTLQSTVRYQYDSRGRVLLARDNGRDQDNPNGHLLERHWYDGPEGNLSKDSLPTSATVSYGYDGYGRPTTVTRTGLPTQTVAYDATNRVINSWDGVNPSPTRYVYGRSLDANGLVTDSVIDPAGNRYAFTRNRLGWTAAETDPTGRVSTFEYDRDGLVRRTVNRRNLPDTIAYDALHRVLSRTRSGVSYSYSTNGREVTATNANAIVTSYRHATRNQIDSVRTTLSGVATAYAQHYRYTAEGQLDSTWVTGAFSSLRRRYRWRPNVGVLDSLRFGAPPRPWTRFTYNSDLQATVTRFSARDSVSRRIIEPHRSAEMHAPGLNEAYGFDAQGRLRRVRPEGEPFSLVFTYDGVRRLQQTAFEHDEQCEWDPQYGLWCAPGTTDSTHAFSFDAVGNRTDHGGAYTMPGNRIQSFDGCGYATDAEGSDSIRTCPGEAASFTWTGDGQLASYTVGGLTWSFGYDPLGRLVRRDSAGVVKSRLLWDGDNLVAELAANGTTTVAEYSYYPGGLDNLHAVFVPGTGGGGFWNAHTDAMGNVRALVGDTGLVGRTYDYDEWGRLQGTSTDPAGFANRDRARWKGALWLGPTLDLYYMRNRWYEPRTGRFLSEDPIGLEGGVNPFVFAGGDPVNGRDPTGLNPWSCTYYGTEFTWHHDNGDGTGWTRTWEQWDWADCYDLGWDSRSRRGPAAGNASANGPALQGDSVQQRASLPPSEPSCGSVEFPGNTGTIYVQTHQNGTVAWGIRMHDPTRDYGAWHVTVYVGIHKEDEKTQNYAPHGSVAPTHATRGAIFRIDATLVDCFGFTHRSVPNGCVIP